VTGICERTLDKAARGVKRRQEESPGSWKDSSRLNLIAMRANRATILLRDETPHRGPPPQHLSPTQHYD